MKPLNTTLLWLPFSGMFLAQACLCLSGETPKPKLPNIVLIVSDDQGYGDASCFWETDLRTPVMDRIAKQGVRLTRFRVNPLCAPTRASVLSGMYSLNAGMWRGPGSLEAGPQPAGGWPIDARRLRDDLRLLPEILREAGYATGAFGKWHLGYDPVNIPTARGFEHFIGFLGGAHPYTSPNSKLLDGTEPLKTNAHTTDLFADAALRFIRENAHQPFFCYLPFNAVHGPLYSEDRPRSSAKPEWLDKYARLGVDQPRRDYCGVMSHADARVGDLIDTLRELDLEKQTFVIYFSDNGGILEKYPSNNGPFRGGKGQSYEGGVRVPAVMQWPDTIPAGSVSDADAAHFDIFSTILSAAGLEVPTKNGPYAVNGCDLMPHLRSGGQEAIADRYLFWDLYGSQAALHGQWKLVGQLSNHHGDFEKGVQEAERSQYELYDLSVDPGEKSDVASDHPAIYDDLKQRHIEWLRTAIPGA